MSLAQGGSDAFSRATIHQAPGSMLRVVQFRGGELVYDRDDQLVLSMGLTANHALEFKTSSCRASVVPLIGRFGLMTPGQRFEIGLYGDCTVIQMVLPRHIAAAWLEEDHEVDGERVDIGWGHSLEDRAVSCLLWAARAGELENEPIVLRAVVARLFERFSPSSKAISRARGSLPLHKVRRVVAMIEDDPTRPFTVEDLAREVSVSPFHFAHQFQAATGRAPHRFMVERRISKAVGLLYGTKIPVVDIAARCGFTHASHLSRQLQRVLGQSPAQLRRAMLL